MSESSSSLNKVKYGGLNFRGGSVLSILSVNGDLLRLATLQLSPVLTCRSMLLFPLVLLIYVTVDVHVVHVMLLIIALGKGCQWNLSWTIHVLFSGRHAVAYSVAS
ncbi:hypothetical protein ACFX10_003062 [Malus domestica]